MYINRLLSTHLGGGLGVNDNTETYLKLTMWKPTGFNRCQWLTVSLNTAQVLRLAAVIQCPPKWQQIKIQDGTTPYTCMWQVLRVKHGNTVFSSSLGIYRPTQNGTTVGLCIKESYGNDKHERNRVTECWYGVYSVILTKVQCRPLLGLLYYWAGSRLIDRKTVTTHTSESILNLIDSEKS